MFEESYQYIDLGHIDDTPRTYHILFCEEGHEPIELALVVFAGVQLAVVVILLAEGDLLVPGQAGQLRHVARTGRRERQARTDVQRRASERKQG